jgi:hypothetical protein
MPHRKYAQHVEYLWRAPSMRAWEQAYLAGDCNPAQRRFFEAKPFEELYDRHTDPWEVNNLADDPAYSDVLGELREATLDWQLSIRDAGFIPEGLLKKINAEGKIYDYAQSEAYPLEKILETASMAGTGDPEDIPELKARLEDTNPIVRYWAAMAGIILGDQASGMIPELEKALGDELAEVRIAAAEALFGLGMEDKALAVFRETLFHQTPETVLYTINAMQELGKEALEPARSALKKVKEGNENSYVNRAATYALETIESS